jgi:chorismate synthase
MKGGSVMEAAVASVVVGILALCGTVISNLVSNSKTIYRIEQLEKKQEKHNNVIERTIVLEKVFSMTEEQIKSMTRDIDAIKKKVYNEK